MGPIPLQRDIVHRPVTGGAGQFDDPRLVSRTSLPGIPLAPSAARKFVRAALAEWAGIGVPAAAGFSDRLADDAVTVANELVTNAVVHAGTAVDLLFRLEEAADETPAALVLEVTDHHPARPVSGERSGAAAALRRSGPTPPSTAAASSSSPPSPNPGASPTAPASRPSGPACPSTSGAPRRDRPRRTRCGAACGPPRSSPPPSGAPNATTRAGTTGARSPSSPRRPTCWRASSTRTSWRP